MNTKTRYKVTATPPRRKIGMTRRSISGVYVFRDKEPVPFESTLERDFLVRLEADRSVISVISQPVTIQYLVDGQPRQYTPDFLVHYRQRPGASSAAPSALIEVKPRDQLAEHLSEWKPRFRAAIRYCLDQGHVFHLMHEDRIRDQVWANVRFLVRYRKMNQPVEMAERILDMLRTRGRATFSEILDASFFVQGSRAMNMAYLWHLVATGRIECDLTERLTNHIELWVPDDV